MDLCDSLIKWLQTFSVENQCQTVEDLIDGVTISQILHQISPRFFSTTWLGKIKSDTVSSDWRLKVSNLKKISKGIADFYAEVVGQHANDLHMPDVNAIVEHADSKELGRLLQLVLGCAVNCEDKHEYIRRIMGMEESVQHDVMKAIQDLMTKEAAVTSAESVATDEQTKKLVDQLQKMTDQTDEYAQRCHDLDLQVVLLQEEKTNLLSEVDRLNERLNQADSLDDPSSVAGRRYLQLQKQAEQLQEDLFRAETSRDEYRVKAEVLQKEVVELQEKNEELESLSEETRQLRDELDILRHTAEKASRYEATITTYKKKLEEMSDLKGQLKILEEKNMEYVQKNLDMEEEVKKGDILKTQLETYRRQVQDLQLKLTEETKRGDKLEFDVKRLQEKFAVVQLDKERLTEELKNSQELYNELVCTKGPAASDVPLNLPNNAGLELMSLPPEARERILRLQHENQQLKMQATSSEDSQLLRSLLDDANAHKHELECQVRSLNQRVLELEANLNDLNELRVKKSESEVAASSEVRKLLNEQMDRCRQLEADLQKRQQLEEELENKLQANSFTINELKSEVTKKEQEVRETEEKYKKYLKKAETLLRQRIDPKTGITAPELTAVKSQLENKDQYLKLVEQENEKIKSTRDLEDKLMVTAWYNLASSLHRKASEDRLTALGTTGHNSPQSFLARQRQVHIRRPPNASLTGSSPNTAR